MVVTSPALLVDFPNERSVEQFSNNGSAHCCLRQRTPKRATFSPEWNKINRGLF